MLQRVVLLCLLLASLSTFASTTKTIRIYHDADYSLNQLSADAMKMGLLTAFSEVNNEIQGYKLEFVEKNHRGNTKRSFLNMKAFIEDKNALFILGGLHSPPYIKHRSFINENQIPLIIPWAAGGPITRYPRANNSVFRLSVDDSKAGIRISEFALNKLSCKNPHLLLENTPWGQSNQKTMSSYLQSRVPFDVSFFGWSIKNNAARVMLRNIISANHDCLFLVANFNETQEFVDAMAATKEDKRIPILSHWGVTGGDVDIIFTEQVKKEVPFYFIQSCYSLSSPEQTSFQRSVSNEAKNLFPSKLSSLENLKAPAGFIHAYDLGRLVVAALQQIELSGDILEDRALFIQALESLQKPVQGLIKKYNKPFTQWSEQQPNAHEALRLENFCMATFGDHNQIMLTAN